MVRIFEEHWPFVFALVRGNITDEDFAHMYATYTRIHQRDQRFYLAQDTRGVKLPDAITRRKLAELNSHFAKDIQQRVSGVGVIVASKIFAGAMRAVYWISRENTPTQYHSSAVACWEEAERSCSAESMALPPAGLSFIQGIDDEHLRRGDFSRFFSK